MARPLLFLVLALLSLIVHVTAFDLGINCGGVSAVNASGVVYQPANNYTNGSVIYQADSFYSGTDLDIVTYSTNLTNLTDAQLYQTERTGQVIRYDVNVPDGNYTVALLLGNIGGVPRGTPRIQVQSLVVSQGAPANSTSASQTITTQASVTTGLLTIILTAANNTPAYISAIRITNNVTSSNATSALPTSFLINSGRSNISNYSADAYYFGPSSTVLSNVRFLIATPQQDARVGPSFGYALNLAPGNYEVDLDLGTGLFNTSGQPTILIQGVPLALPANASAVSTAAYVSNGLLSIQLIGVNGSNATLASVRVVPSGNSQLVAVAAGSPTNVLLGRGIVFSQDQYFTGGNNFTLTNLTSNFSFPSYDSAEVDSGFYKSFRTGNFSYSLPLVLPGAYTVDLHFAEPSATGPGQRVFNVLAQNTVVLSSLDIYNITGANLTALVLQVPVNLTQGGNLTLTFQGSSPLPPLVNAIFVHSAPGSIPSLAPAPAPNSQTLPAVAPASTPSTTPVAATTAAAVPSAPAVTPAAAPSVPAVASPPTAAQSPAAAPVATSSFTGLSPAQAGSLPSVATGSIFGVPVLSNSPPATNNGAYSYAVVCGNPNSYTASNGIVFNADNTPCNNLRDMPPGSPYCRFDDDGATGGFASSTNVTVTGTTDPEIFMSERIGTNHYLFTVPPGEYSVNCFFAEISVNDTSIYNVNKTGERVLNIQYLGISEGEILGVDPFHDAGDKKYAPSIRSHTVQTAGPYLEVYFMATGSRDEPKIGAIWIYSTDSPLS